ncbi:MAG: hypothetical protein ABIT01_20725, partial [Thermoanaerobaculia bacterium]
MSFELSLRVVAFLAALFIANRYSGRLAILCSGAFAALALFGVSAQAFPSPGQAATLVTLLTLFHGLSYMTTWSPVVSEAAVSGALLALPAAVSAAGALRHEPRWLVFSGVAGVLAALSLFSAEASRANSEAGWRRGVMWPAAVVLP